MPGLPWAGWEWVAQLGRRSSCCWRRFAALTYITAIDAGGRPCPAAVDAIWWRQHDYPDLGRHGEDVFWGSLGNTLGGRGHFPRRQPG
jgi:hypothetical protein